MDALSSNLAILNEEGVIIYVNRAWRAFAEANPPAPPNANEGANYLEVCDQAQGADRYEAAAMAEGIRAILRGEREEYTLEYPCHSPGERRWFVARVTRFIEDGKIRVVVAHENVTAQKIEELQIQESERRIRAMFALSERREQERALLDRVRTTLANELDLAVILRTVVEAIAETFGYTLVSLYLLKDERLLLQHQVGYDTVIPEILISEGVSGRVVRTGRAVLIEDAHADPAFLEAMQEIVSEVCVPLSVEGRVIGILNVESFRGVTLTEADLELMTALSENVSVAIQRARLYTQARDAEERYRSFIDHAAEAIYIYNAESRILQDANPAFLKLTGYSLEEARQLSLYDIVAHDRVEIDGLLKAILEHGASVLGERKWRRKDGSLVDMYITVSAARQAGQTYLLVQGLDITERQRMSRALAESEAELRALFASMQDTVLVIDRNGTYRRIAPTHPGKFYIPPEQVIGKHLSDLFSREETERFLDVIQRVLETRQTLHVEYDIPVNGETPWFEASVSPMDEDTTLWVARDVTERRLKEEELRRANQQLEIAHRDLQHMFEHEQVLARTDGLTGLNNRRYFFELATREFEACRRFERSLSIILFDVDGFKKANDTFGHDMGDKILVQIARAANSQVREVDVLARYGGDEFIVMLPQTPARQALHIAERIRRRVASTRVESDSGPLAVTISLGVAEMTHTPPDPFVEDAIRRADQALYAAKARGHNQSVIYPL
ncbi:MAG: diguanylate cyclase [Chloroflexota bacterium]